MNEKYDKKKEEKVRAEKYFWNPELLRTIKDMYGDIKIDDYQNIEKSPKNFFETKFDVKFKWSFKISNQIVTVGVILFLIIAVLLIGT